MAVTQEGVTTQPLTLPQELILMLLNEGTGHLTPGARLGFDKNLKFVISEQRRDLPV